MDEFLTVSYLLWLTFPEATRSTWPEFVRQLVVAELTHRWKTEQENTTHA